MTFRASPSIQCMLQSPGVQDISAKLAEESGDPTFTKKLGEHLRTLSLGTSSELPRLIANSRCQRRVTREVLLVRRRRQQSHPGVGASLAKCQPGSGLS